MSVREIARELPGKAANVALRMPIAGVDILAGPPVAVDGRTLDGRTLDGRTQRLQAAARAIDDMMAALRHELAQSGR